MWTPRRFLLLVGCFVSFFSVYLGYAYTEVGRIDGLPPLPETYWPVEGVPLPLADIKPTASKLDVRMKEAFGADCQELKWPIRLEDHRRNMLIAAEQMQVRDGKIYLTPLSVALYGKQKNDNLPVEINTIRSTVAILTFDRPVTSFSEISIRKVTEAELNGRIEIVSNRRRTQRDQDLKVLIPNGPLFYRESTHKIWTEAVVTLEDHKTKPANVIHGQGMEMELLTEAAQTTPGGRKTGKDSISGVKWVALNSSVDMTLYLDGQVGLMGPAQGGPAKGATAQPSSTPNKPVTSDPPKKAKLIIKTPGRFLYEMNKDHDLATFTVHPAGPIVPPRKDKPRHVEATRTNPDGKEDYLVCHQLTLRLRRKESGEPKPLVAARPGVQTKPVKAAGSEDHPIEGTEIESMTAIADFTRPTSQVTLVTNSDNSSMSATGRDFYHSAPKGLTILKGQPVEVHKTDHKSESKIVAPEIRIQNVTPPPVPGKPPVKPYQDIYATGPGDILLVEKKDNKRTQANWEKLLTSTREGEQDLLTLTGAARFIDEGADQSLRAETLKVWLDLPDAKQASERQEGISSGRKPRHLEATGNVVARSRDMNIHDTGRLVVLFTDEAPQTTLPAVGSATGPRPGVTPGRTTSGGGTLPSRLPEGPSTIGPVPTINTPATTTPAGPALGAPATNVEARPFDLSARSVEAKVVRGTLKNTIDELYCDGAVVVRQDPAKAEEKGTEVKGDTLRMTAGLGGYFLVVTADEENLAELTTDKIYIMGPEVNIDQTSNRAWVVGGGAMRMESATNFQGEKLEKAVPLTVHWENRMVFNGESAEFTGNITAEQEKSRLACQHLQVNFDKPISLKQGNKTAEPARVSQMICDKDVRIEDRVFTGTELTKYTRLEGPVVQMRALELDEDAPLKPLTPGGKTSTGNEVFVRGSGNISIWEPANGEDAPGLTSPAPKPATGKKATPPKKAPEMKMTYVAFKERMDANSKTSKAIFWGDVHVLNLPWPKHDETINLEKILAIDLPEGAILIRCDKLLVLDHPSQGKSNKQMEGHGRVTVQGRDFDASGLSIYYNQLKEQIILEGSESVPAVLQKETRPGDERKKLEGRKIIYNRKTGNIYVEGASSINGESPGRR